MVRHSDERIQTTLSSPGSGWSCCVSREAPRLCRSPAKAESTDTFKQKGVREPEGGRQAGLPHVKKADAYNLQSGTTVLEVSFSQQLIKRESVGLDVTVPSGQPSPGYLPLRTAVLPGAP